MTVNKNRKYIHVCYLCAFVYVCLGERVYKEELVYRSINLKSQVICGHPSSLLIISSIGCMSVLSLNLSTSSNVLGGEACGG